MKLSMVGAEEAKPFAKGSDACNEIVWCLL